MNVLLVGGDLIADGSRVSRTLLEALERRIVVSPSLRGLVLGLPEDPDRSAAQRDAVAAMVVLNVWICAGPQALGVLRELDEVTGAAFALYPRSRALLVATEEDVRRARAELLGLATRLGFGPGHRVRLANATGDALAGLLPLVGSLRVAIDVEVGPPARLVVRGVPAMGRTTRVELGSGRWLGLRRLRDASSEYLVGADPFSLRVAFQAGAGAAP